MSIAFRALRICHHIKYLQFRTPPRKCNYGINILRGARLRAEVEWLRSFAAFRRFSGFIAFEGHDVKLISLFAFRSLSFHPSPRRLRFFAFAPRFSELRRRKMENSHRATHTRERAVKMKVRRKSSPTVRLSIFFRPPVALLRNCLHSSATAKTARILGNKSRNDKIILSTFCLFRNFSLSMLGGRRATGG